MWRYLIKLALSAALIVLVSEVSRRSSWLGGLLASLPIVSYLAIIWLYLDTHDPAKVSGLSIGVFWLVLPSLPFFVVLPALLKKMAFVPSLLIATGVLFACYGLTVLALRGLGVAVK